MAQGRRGFLHSLFISPAVAKARVEQIEAENQQKAQEVGLAPEQIKPRCGVCDSVLINGKCQWRSMYGTRKK